MTSLERAATNGNHSDTHPATVENDMLPRTQVRTLVRELSATKVLSVYLDMHASDPAMRDAWHPALMAALREAGAALSGDDHAEFQRAAAHLEGTALSGSEMWAGPGWMALATADGVRMVNRLPLRTPTMAVWREGPVIAPYLRALKQHHPPIVALAVSSA